MSDDKEDDPLATGAGLQVFAAVSPFDRSSLIGRELDGYRITDFIAEGGMSLVYRAERVDGSFERDVAIKVTQAGFTASHGERFLHEQQVLAGLNHAHISQLYDARVTPEGWPYIVMEYVDGLPITAFCGERALSDRDRLRLLIDVVDAVAYAHANLVVHRDIKPSNVLVNTEGSVKLLDFGIAKLLEEESGDLTRSGAMTPRYASPEQLLGLPVSTASDIYQLGFLMAEVLTGAPVTTEEPLSDAIRRVADGKSLTLPDASRRLLPAEITHVIEQCLRVDPADRYRDANSLRDDLHAYLAGYPVSAAGQRSAYRFRKFVTRNRAAVFISVVAVFAIVAGSIGYAVSINNARQIAEAQRDEADRQANIARESLDFLSTILSSANPDVAQRGNVTIREALDAGIERIETDLAGQPEIQSRLYLDLSLTYQNLGDPEMQQKLLDLAEAPTLEAYGPRSEEYLRLKLAKGTRYYGTGDFEGGKAYYEALVDEIADVLGPRHILALRARTGLGNNLWGLGDMEGFAEIAAENLRYAEESLGAGDEFTLNAAHNLAIALVDQGRLEDAVELSSRYSTLAEASVGPGHTATLSLLSILASAQGYLGNLDEELALRQTIIDRQIVARGERHPAIGSAKVNLAYVYNDLGQFEQAERLFSEAVDIWTASLGEDNPTTLRGRRNLAVFQARHGLNPRAISDLEEVIDEQTAQLGAEHPNTVESRLHRAEFLLREGAGDAEDEIASMLETGDRVLGPDNPVMQRFREAVAEIQGAQAR